MSIPEPAPDSPPPSPWAAPPWATAGVTRPQTTIAWLALALAIVVLLVATAPFWAPGVVPLLPWSRANPERGVDAASMLQGRLDADETKLTALGARLAALEARPVATPPRLAASPPAPATLQLAPQAQSPEIAAAIKALQDQMAKLAGQSTTTGDRLTKLETTISNAGEKGRADRTLLLALANLRVAVEGSAPFAAELAAVQTLAEGKPEVKQALAPLGVDAKSGLPSLAALTERFDRSVAPAILRARAEIASTDWGDQILARLERLVVIRRIAPGGPAPSDVAEAAVAQADAALKAGDLTGAVAALGKLSGPSAAAAAPWLAQAKTRVAAEADLAKLWREESARIAADGAGGKP
jgi:hypothetical protein